MTDRLRLTILGCGSSPGVPRIIGDWGACNPDNPRNRRLRAAALVERIKPDGRTTRVAIDTGPDFRQQMISAGVTSLDGVAYTHSHADHIHGIDDLRGYVLAQRRLMDIYAEETTVSRIREAFAYCFETPPGSSYPPIVLPHFIHHGGAFTVTGEGGPLTLTPFLQIHGDIHSLGFRVGDFAYCSDVSDFPAETVPLLSGLNTLIIDALQYRPHASHFSLGEALEWIERLAPKHAVLTHMHTPLDYDAVQLETPEHVVPAYDGMTLEDDIIGS